MNLKLIKSWIFIIGLAFYVTGCSNYQKQKKILWNDVFSNQSSKVKYARFFELYEYDNITKLVIKSPFDDSNKIVYYLVDTTRDNNLEIDEKHVIKVPLKHVGVLSATQLAGIKKIGFINNVKGVSDVKYLQDSDIKRRLELGEIEEIASGNNFFTEKALLMKMDAIFFSPFKKGQQLEINNSVPVIPFFDFMEESPLGRAEWLKFTAAFFAAEKNADTLFESIATKYELLKKKVEKVKDKPTVFSGKNFNGQWFVPGGKSYIAKIFTDAGADYIFKDILSVNSVALDFEVVFHKAESADYWRLTGGLDTTKNPYDYLQKKNKLYSQFKAFRKHHIIYCDPVATGYFEKGPLEPHIILSDFIYIFHKDMLPNHKPAYYRLIP